MTTSAVALVTGANKGIGKQIARGLGREGLTVLATARTARRGQQAADELAQEGLDVPFRRLDVVDGTSVAEAARTVAEEFGRLDVLVNNAGVPGDLGAPPSATDVATMRAVLETNVLGAVAVTNAMLPLLRRSAAGRVVNVSSGLGSLADHTADASELPLFLAYNTSKTALNAVTVHFARELRDTAIKVNACAPGRCATDLNGHAGDRTPAEGARIAVRLATAGADGPTGGFFSDEGPVPW